MHWSHLGRVVSAVLFAAAAAVGIVAGLTPFVGLTYALVIIIVLVTAAIFVSLITRPAKSSGPVVLKTMDVSDVDSIRLALKKGDRAYGHVPDGERRRVAHLRDRHGGRGVVLGLGVGRGRAVGLRAVGDSRTVAGAHGHLRVCRRRTDLHLGRRDRIAGLPSHRRLVHRHLTPPPSAVATIKSDTRPRMGT